MSVQSRAAVWPLAATAAALILSPVLLAVSGESATYNIALVVLMLAVWFGQKLSRREVGFVIGDRASYVAAVGYVFVIVGIVAIGAWASGLIDLKDYSHMTAFRRLTLNSLITFLLTLVMEDGFFRGTLWGSCERAGYSPTKTLIWTSVAFGLWHLMVPILDPDFAQPLSKVPQYVIGSTAFGFAMGALRMRSGSIIIPSLCHGLWNGSVYTFFGAGEKTGLLGITDTNIWDPERGYSGLVLTIIAAALLWKWAERSKTQRATA